jgi:hypothetical protein
MSRANTFYASAADRERTHSVRLLDGEVRTIALDLAAVLNGATISAVTWTLESSGVVSKASPTVGTDTATLRLSALDRGLDVLTATVTLSTGDVLIERFAVEVA